MSDRDRINRIDRYLSVTNGRASPALRPGSPVRRRWRSPHRRRFRRASRTRSRCKIIGTSRSGKSSRSIPLHPAGACDRGRQGAAQDLLLSPDEADRPFLERQQTRTAWLLSLARQADRTGEPGTADERYRGDMIDNPDRARINWDRYLGHNIACVAVDGNGEIIDFDFNHNDFFRSSAEHAESRMVRRLFSLTDIFDSWRTGQPSQGRSKAASLNEVTLYTSLESCAQCSGVMSLAQVKQIVYLQNDFTTYKIGNIMFNWLNPVRPVAGSAQADPGIGRRIRAQFQALNDANLAFPVKDIQDAHTRNDFHPLLSPFPPTRLSPITTRRSPLFPFMSRGATLRGRRAAVDTLTLKFPERVSTPDERERPPPTSNVSRRRAASSNTPTSKDIAAPRSKP